MKKTTKIIIALVVTAVIATGGVLLLGEKSDNKSSSESTTSPADSKNQTTIVYTEGGFSPANVRVAAGGSITMVNQSSEAAEPSSDPHPAHTDNPELNFGDIEPGKSKTLTVNTTGTWGIHNHYSKDKRGTITVE